MSKMNDRFTDRVRAAYAAGLPLPLIQGGDGSTEPTAGPPLPRSDDGALDRAALSELSVEDLQALDTEIVAYLTERRAAVASVADVEALAPYIEARAALAEIVTAKTAAPEDLDAALSALDAAIAIDASAPAPEGETPEGEHAAAPEGDTPAATTFQITDEQLRLIVHGERTPPATEPVTADGSAPAVLPALPTAAMTFSERAAQAATRPGTVITAAGDVPNFAAGDELADVVAVAEAIISKRESIGQPGKMNGQDLCRVARFTAEWPEDRYLRKGDTWETINSKVNAIASPQAIVASGGLCAPVQPYYDIMTIAEAARPVRDSLAEFRADRGGIKLIPPPQLADASGSIGFITAAVDAAALGGNQTQIGAATKPCIHVACPAAQEYDLAAVTRCLEFGNLTTRAYPEQVAAWVTLSMAQWARKGETALIDGIAAASTQVTAAKVVGAARDIIAGIVKAAAYYRNHNRMLVNATLRVMMPAWVIDLMVADLTHGSGYELEYFTMARAEIEAALAELDINVTFYMDSGTGKGQLFNSGNAQTTGALVAFPSTVVWYLFAEGSFLFLDGGTLDFGVVRDSTLNALNNYRLFAESFEQVAFVGVESLEVTQTVVADGTFAGTAYGSSTVASPVAIPSSY